MPEDNEPEQPTAIPGILRFYLLALTGFMGFIIGAVAHVVLG